LATVKVQMSTEAESDSAEYDDCDSKCNWGRLSLLIPENVTAVAKALAALSRNSAKDLAPTSTHWRAVSIRYCIDCSTLRLARIHRLAYA